MKAGWGRRGKQAQHARQSTPSAGFKQDWRESLVGTVLRQPVADWHKALGCDAQDDLLPVAHDAVVPRASQNSFVKHVNVMDRYPDFDGFYTRRMSLNFSKLAKGMPPKSSWR